MFVLFSYFASCVLVFQHEEKSFLSWMRANNQYFTGDDYYFRLGIYLANSQFVHYHNNANKGFKVSLNKFSVYTHTEYKALLNQITKTSKPQTNRVATKKDWPTPPDELDWRTSGAVTDAVDQGPNCASGWAFACVAGAEGCWFVNKGELLKFSEQNLIDCVNTCYGCEGGLTDDCYTYIIINQGGKFMLEADYPYTGTEGSCQFDSSKGVGGIRGWIQPKKEEELVDYIAHYGPIVCTMDASSMSFSTYTSGIYSDNDNCDPLSINHGICLIGYGTENDVKYWIAKNSWGKEWGEDGFVRMIRGKDICGIAVSPIAVYYDII